MKTLKLTLLVMIFLSLGMLIGCHGGHGSHMQKEEKDLTLKQVIWEPAISSDHFDPKSIYLEADQGR